MSSRHSGPRLQVLQIVDSLSTGGAEQLLVTLGRYLDATAFEMTVCSLWHLVGSPIERDLRAQGTRVFSLGGARFRDPRYLVRLTEQIRHRRIDVMHTHLRNANIFGAIAGAWTRKPVVSTLHAIAPVHERQDGIVRGMQLQALRRQTDVIIACGPEVAEDALSRLRLPRTRLTVVPNGIDLHAYTSVDAAAVLAVRREFLGKSAGPLIVSVGTVRAVKGHQYLVDAAPTVLRAFPGARFVIVGKEDDNVAAVHARIDAHRLHDHVVLAGVRRDIPAIVSAADLFVFPSLSEALPLSLLEAMAAGTPVVASAVGGIPGVIEDGATGSLVPPAEPGALAAAMLSLLQDGARARRVSDAARRLVEHTYSAETWARTLEAIYTRLAAGH